MYGICHNIIADFMCLFLSNNIWSIPLKTDILQIYNAITIHFEYSLWDFFFFGGGDYFFRLEYNFVNFIIIVYLLSLLSSLLLLLLVVAVLINH